MNGGIVSEYNGLSIWKNECRKKKWKKKKNEKQAMSGVNFFVSTGAGDPSRNISQAWLSWIFIKLGIFKIFGKRFPKIPTGFQNF